MVANALGISAAGQEPAVTVQETTFQAMPIEKISPVMGTGMVDAVKPWVTPLLAVVIVLFFARQLKRPPADPIPLELLDPANSSALDNAKPAKMLRDRPRAGSVSPEMLNDMIRQKPENVSATLREWMTEKP